MSNEGSKTYDPPRVVDLGAFADLTQGFSGNENDNLQAEGSKA